jgi:hypothetical protein
LEILAESPSITLKKYSSWYQPRLVDHHNLITECCALLGAPNTPDLLETLLASKPNLVASAENGMVQEPSTLIYYF